MVEKTLLEKLQAIFEVDKVTLDQPAGPEEALEQECLFVQIDTARNRFKDGRWISRVNGRAMMVAQGEKMPIGYFSKCIAAHPDQTKDFFFYEFEESTKLYNNIVQRGFSFVYFFSSQHDPAIGTITSVTTEVEVSS